MSDISVKNPYAIKTSPKVYVSRYMRWSLFLVLGGLGSGLIWASVAHLDSASHAPGRIIVDKRTQVVKHLEGGIINNVLVQDGQMVRQGDALLEMSDVRSRADYQRFFNSTQHYKASISRLEAEITTFAKKPNFDQNISADILATQQQLYQNRRDMYFARKKAYEQQIASSQNEINGLREQIETVKKQKAMNADVLDARRKLVEQKILSRTAILDQETRDLQYERDLTYTNTQIASTQKRIQELQTQIIDLRNSVLERANNELNDARNQYEQSYQNMTTSRDIMKRTIIQAPEDGIVMALKYSVAGAVVQPSEPLLNIVPEHQERFIEAKVNVQDVSRIKVGQKARVTLSAYKSSEVPVLEGQVEYISPDSTSDQGVANPVPYYSARIKLPASEVAKIPHGEEGLIPGMQSDVTIITGERSALRYMVQPLLDSLKYSFNEH